jgi:type I restriction enzyme, S subunit
MKDEPECKLPILGLLPSKWQIVEFGSVLEDGTRNGIYKPKQFHGEGDKIVNMGELFSNPRLYDVPMKRILLSEVERKSFGLKVGDLLFARRSLVAEGAGKCSIVCEINEPTTFESSIIRARPNKKIADSIYLYYVFLSRFGAYLLDTIRRQVAVAGITGKDLVKLTLPLPPIYEQHYIASTLSTIDDKIELNRQMKKTLESLTTAIFKAWFVDFDPVRSKIVGHQPFGIDAETATFFPDSFENSPLERVQEGCSSGSTPLGILVFRFQWLRQVS